MSSIGAQFLSDAELSKLGLAHVGRNVLIHPTVVIVDGQNLSVGDESRIDPYTVIVATASVVIGSHVHVGASCYIAGGGTVVLQDFAGLSQGVCIYSVSDDYSGRAMTNPTVPHAYTDLHKAPVNIGRHVIVGAGSVILPGVSVADGCAIGALSLASRSLEPWGIYAGIPCRRLRRRRDSLLSFEQALIRNKHGKPG